MYDDNDEDDQNQLGGTQSGQRVRSPFGQNQLGGAKPAGTVDPTAFARGQLAGAASNGDSRVQAQPDDRSGGAGAPPPTAPPATFARTSGTPGPAANAAAPALQNFQNRMAGAAAPAAAAPAAPTAAAGGAGGVMPWLAPIANALAEHQQERQMRRDAAANIGMQYGQSQGDYPTYGYQAAQQNRRINDRMGGAGIGALLRMRR